MPRRWRRVVLVALVVLAFVPSGAAQPQAPGADGPRLRVEGRWLVDEHGRVVLLHGVNNVDKTPPYVELGDGFTLTGTDAALLAEHGFNVVRLGVEFDGLMPAKGDVDESYLDRVVAVVDLLGRAGLHVLIDHHQDSMSAVFLGGNGFPAWAVEPKPFPGEPDVGWPLNSGTMLSLNLAWTNVWNDTHGVVGYLGDAFEALARRLRGNPAVLGFEIMNEPWPGTVFPTCVPLGCPLFDAQYQRVHERLTRRIREGDPDMTVFWEPHTMWNFTIPSHLGTPPLTPPISDPSIVFSFHDYCAFNEGAIYLGLPEDLVALCDVQHDRTWSNYDTFAARTGLPAMVTEFGGDADAVVVERTLTRADRRLVGWIYWHYASIDGPEREDDPFTGAFGRQVVRTYPQATAGVPMSLSFDPGSGVMRYRYRPTATAAPTVIYVSDLHAPDGYTARVTGGRVTSVPCARHVTIEAQRGAQMVDVSIAPGSCRTVPSSDVIADRGSLPAVR